MHNKKFVTKIQWKIQRNYEKEQTKKTQHEKEQLKAKRKQKNHTIHEKQTYLLVVVSINMNERMNE